MTVHGLLLAAGAGRRMGMPKALLRDRHGIPFVIRGIEILRGGGCGAVSVVVGAAADEVSALVSDMGVTVVPADGWAEGMGASLRAGLVADSLADAEAVLVGLVDLPDVGPEVVRRLLTAVAVDARVLARAAYDGAPGHPVLIGRDHWAGVLGSATGDRGARDYLARNAPQLVECGDLATGRDVDHPEAL